MTSGPLLFARFAYPPNALGYCGPDDSVALLEQAADGSRGADVKRGLRRLARGFAGAWPYLELIAGANRIRDPLDRRVVEAYWIGNALLDRAAGAALGRSLEERFAGRAGTAWERLVEPVYVGAVPHHAFHVFAVYPWVGLLRSGLVEQPLHVLDHCRIRWGQVEAVIGDRVVVRSSHLTWDGHRLSLGPPTSETAVLGDAGLRLAGPLDVGDWCALHWDWVCDRLAPHQLAALQRRTAEQLAAVAAVPHPAPAAVLG